MNAFVCLAKWVGVDLDDLVSKWNSFSTGYFKLGYFIESFLAVQNIQVFLARTCSIVLDNQLSLVVQTGQISNQKWMSLWYTLQAHVYKGRFYLLSYLSQFADDSILSNFHICVFRPKIKHDVRQLGDPSLVFLQRSYQFAATQIGFIQVQHQRELIISASVHWRGRFIPEDVEQLYWTTRKVTRFCKIMHMNLTSFLPMDGKYLRWTTCVRYC